MTVKDKRYYWLKLKRDFFKRHDIRIIESMPNGKDYILFYLKLLCESVDHEGNLRFSDKVPYNEQMLATITNTNVDIVRSAIKVFMELHMMELMDDGTFYMNEVERMLGSETYWAQKKREYREKDSDKQQEKVGQIPTKSNSFPTCPSKSIDKDKDIDKDIENLIGKYHDLCPSLPRIRKLTNTRKKKMKARIASIGVESIKEAFKKAEMSDFLTGRSGTWRADLDWMMKNDENVLKILEGRYDNRNQPKPVSPYADAWKRLEGRANERNSPND